MDVKDRIKKIIEMEDISQAEFSRITGINTSTLSHVLTGRNNPSMEVVNKILSAYTRYSSHWLINGEGHPLRDSQESMDNNSLSPLNDYPNNKVFTSHKSLFEEHLETPLTGEEEKYINASQIQQDSSADVDASHHNPNAIQRIGLSESPSKSYSEQKMVPPKASVKRIIVYYDDNTFESFIPEKESK